MSMKVEKFSGLENTIKLMDKKKPLKNITMIPADGSTQSFHQQLQNARLNGQFGSYLLPKKPKG